MRLTPLLAFLPVLTYAQQDDSWFQARVSFRDRYLTLAELGQRVQAKSDVPVMVDRGIAERKISVFCDGLPLGQVMRRVADTMFMEWAPEGQGLRLRFTAEAAKEERLTVLHEDEIVRSGILKALDDRIALTQDTPAAFRAEAEELKASLHKLEQDTTKAGKLRYADALARYGFLSLLLYDRQLWDEGYALSQLPVERVHALLEGQPLAASTAPMPGMLRLPREALSASHLGESMPMAKDLLMIVRYDPAAHAVTFTKRSLGDENSFTSSASVIAPLESVLNREALADQPLPKHLSEWAKPLDMSVMAHPLDHEVKILPDGGEAHGWTLADNLQWLHDRTGLPIVADAFRIVASYDKPSAGDTVAGWLKNLNALRRTSPITWGVDWATGRVRTEAGWLMVRHGDFWRRLPSEIPERSLRAMEAKAAERPLALDDYANFAAGLTSTQAAALKVTSPLARFPT